MIKAPYSYRIQLVLVGAKDAELETLQINPAALPRGWVRQENSEVQARAEPGALKPSRL